MSFDDMPPLPPLVLPGGPEYADRVLALSRDAVARSRAVLDIPFGDDYWQKLDLFLPEDASLSSLPVLLFVHGGAWSKGYKEWMGFMAPVVTGFPAIFAATNHRKAPSAKFPKPLDDCFSALEWVYRNVSLYGGDPDRIFVGGHSSGGHLASLVALRRDLAAERGLPDRAVKGCFPVSAPLNLHLDVATGRRRELIRQLLARDEDDAAASPVDHTAGNRAAFLLCWGSDDLPEVPDHNRLMAERLAREDCLVRELVLEGCGHFATNLAAADPSSAWVTAVRAIITGRERSC